jgi:hypothetical protein
MTFFFSIFAADILNGLGPVEGCQEASEIRCRDETREKCEAREERDASLESGVKGK